MATENPKSVESREASETIAVNLLLKEDTGANEVGVADSATADAPAGVSRHAAVDGDAIAVATEGTVKVKVGTGGVSKGDKLTAESGGTAITTTTDTHNVWGIAQAAGDASDIIPMKLTLGAMIAG